MAVDDEIKNGRPVGQGQAIVSMKSIIEGYQRKEVNRNSMQQHNTANDELSLATKQLKKATAIRKDNE